MLIPCLSEPLAPDGPLHPEGVLDRYPSQTNPEFDQEYDPVTRSHSTRLGEEVVTPHWYNITTHSCESVPKPFHRVGGTMLIPCLPEPLAPDGPLLPEGVLDRYSAQANLELDQRRGE